MYEQSPRAYWKRFEIKIILILLASMVALALVLFLIIHTQYYSLAIKNRKDNAAAVYHYAQQFIDENSFKELNTIDDEKKAIYLTAYKQMDQIRHIANLRYLYTAKKNAQGEYIYVLNGLDREAEDFRHVGMPIEEEIIPQLEKCLQGQEVFEDDILETDWGVVYVAYFPVMDRNGAVLGAICMEFDVEKLYFAYRHLRFLLIGITVALVVIFLLIAITVLKKVSQAAKDELFEKDSQIMKAKAEALASTKAKSEFLSRMSHEIRTPMNAIIGMTKIAKRTAEMSKIQYCLEKIDRTSKQLMDIINNVLDMSRIEANTFEIASHEFDFENMLQRVFNAIQPKVDEKRQKFVFECKEMFTRAMISDELRLSRVLINLLDNATKFTPEYGILSLKINQTPLDDDHSTIHVEVKDTGIGMTPEEQSRLFTMFAQMDNDLTRRFGGTGLGLVVCKEIVNLMGGDILVESEPEQGSRFRFSINVGWGDEILRPVPHSAAHEDLRILVVDDAEDVLEYLSNVLESLSLKNDCASTGEQALDMVSSALQAGKPYDLIFIDWNMPDLTGGQTAKEIKRVMDDDILLVAISALDWAEIEDSAKALGIANFLPKPILPSALLNMIMRLTSRTFVQQSSGTMEGLPDWSGKNILLAEDMELNREVAVTILEGTGISIDAADDGLEAVELFRRQGEKYHLILMDVQMPRVDGLTATKTIRASGLPNAMDIPIIAMTANAFREDVQACLDAGMNGHITKPVDMDELIRLLSMYLS